MPGKIGPLEKGYTYRLTMMLDHPTEQHVTILADALKWLAEKCRDITTVTNRGIARQPQLVIGQIDFDGTLTQDNANDILLQAWNFRGQVEGQTKKELLWNPANKGWSTIQTPGLQITVETDRAAIEALKLELGRLAARQGLEIRSITISRAEDPPALS